MPELPDFNVSFTTAHHDEIMSALHNANNVIEAAHATVMVAAEQPLHEADQTITGLLKKAGGKVNSLIQPSSRFVSKAQDKINVHLANQLDEVAGHMRDMGIRPATMSGLVSRITGTQSTVDGPNPGCDPSQWTVYRSSVANDWYVVAPGESIDVPSLQFVGCVPDCQTGVAVAQQGGGPDAVINADCTSTSTYSVWQGAA